MVSTIEEICFYQFEGRDNEIYFLPMKKYDFHQFEGGDEKILFPPNKNYGFHQLRITFFTNLRYEEIWFPPN